MDWLDRVTLQRLEDIVRELTAKESQVEEFSLSDEEAELRSSCTLTIELPSFHFPVVHEDKTYGGVGGKGFAGSRTMIPAFHEHTTAQLFALWIANRSNCTTRAS